MSEPESNQQPLQWESTPGVPVYGLTPGAPPPDLDAAWRGAPAVVQAPGAALGPAPTEPAAPAAIPVVMPVTAWRILPPALGPALTPEERAAQLRAGGRDV